MSNRITKEQRRLYMENRKGGDLQSTAAAKAGISTRSAKRLEKGAYIKQHHPKYGSPSDPFAKVWKTQLIPLLERDPLLSPITLMRDLQERYPNEYPDSLLRTLQRRVRDWKAINGKEKERIFRQEHPPGFQGISDFTDCDELLVTIGSTTLSHLLYHFRVPFSGWAYAFVILGGESYIALSTGFQNALWELGGVPETHRTDSLSAAYKNRNESAREDLTKAYNEMCAYYDVKPTRNNKGVKHENGSIESPHRHLKKRIDQKLRLRGSRDFTVLQDYRDFVDEIVRTNNSRRQAEIAEERKHLKPLPKHRVSDYAIESVSVPNTGIITVRQAYYAVPSRLIGHTLTVHVHDDRLECFHAATHIITFPRLRWSKAGPRPRNIDYRLVIPELVRKPQAFRHYVFRDDLFPSDEFRQAWILLDAQLDERMACKEMVQILKIAADGHQQQIAAMLRKALREQRIPSFHELQTRSTEPKQIIPLLQIEQHDLGSYDELLKQASL
jgi:transposase InsO family protein